MHLAVGARALSAAGVGLAVIATAAAGLALSAPGPGRPAAASASGEVLVSPGAVRLEHETRQGPSDTEQCQQTFHISCYNPAQIQQAYDLPTLYSRGITGKGATIVVVDPYGSPTIAGDLRTFDREEGIANPPSLRIIRPAGKVPAFKRGNAGMAGWASETTLDVEYAHTIAPGAKILLVETPGGSGTGNISMTQVITAEKYVIAHGLGTVISQSFVASEQSIGSAGIQALRGAYTDAYRHHVTVLSGAGDSGAAGYQANGSSFYRYPVTGWPASDPLVTAVGGTRLNLDSSGHRNSADTVWNDTYSKTANQLINGNNGPDPLAGGGGTSVIFSRPAYQNTVSRVVGDHRGHPRNTGTRPDRQRRGGQPPRRARHLDERGLLRSGQHLPELRRPDGRLVRAVRHQRSHAAVRRRGGARRSAGGSFTRPDQPGAVPAGRRARPGHRARHLGQ